MDIVDRERFYGVGEGSDREVMPSYQSSRGTGDSAQVRKCRSQKTDDGGQMLDARGKSVDIVDRERFYDVGEGSDREGCQAIRVAGDQGTVHKCVSAGVRSQKTDDGGQMLDARGETVDIVDRERFCGVGEGSDREDRG